MTPPLASLPRITLGRSFHSHDGVDADRPLQTSYPAQVDPVLQTAASVPSQFTSTMNFEGVSADGLVVPDPNGAVGATQYVQWVNVDFAVYDKSTGSLAYGPADAATLWQNFPPCNTTDDDDIIVQYDKLANVWVFTQHVAPSGGPYYQCVAVSTGSDATGSYNRYVFPLPDNFPDYPKLGVWPDAYYLTVNEQNPTTFAAMGALVCALDRISMLTGSSATEQCFQLASNYNSLLPSDVDGAIPPPNGTPDYLMNIGPNCLRIWKFHVDWTTTANSTLNGPITIPVAAFTPACKGAALCVPQLNTTQLLDGIGDRLMYRLAYRHFASGQESLVASHSVGQPSGIRWYEIQNLESYIPVVFQQGTFAPDSDYRWVPSAAMDGMGDIAVGYSVSSSSMYPAIRYTGRLQSDPAGTLDSEASIIEGAGAENGSNRWGDYTAISVDPVDDCTFWYTNEYFPSTGDYNWHTRIASFAFPSCSRSPAVSVAPNSVIFPPQPLGSTSGAKPVTITNNQSAPLTINSISESGVFGQTNNCGSVLAGMSSCTISVTFSPTNAGTASGQILINDSAPYTPQAVNLLGTGGVPEVSLNKSSLSFQTFPGTMSGTIADRITNSGTGPLIVGAVTASGDYTTKTNCLSTSPIAPGSYCTVYVTFSPTVTGLIPGAITIFDNTASAPHVINLSGTGLTTIAVSPATITYGTVPVGSTSTVKIVTVTNNAGTSQTFTYNTSGNFSVGPAGTAPCAPSPAILQAKTSCTVGVSFSPTTNGTNGTVKGALTVSDSANVPYNPQIVSLAGSATGGTTPALSFSPIQLQVGNVVLGTTTGAKKVSVSNTSTTSVTLASLMASGNYSLNSTQQAPCTNGQVLAPGSSCSFTVSFSPTTISNISGSVTISDTVVSSPSTEVYNLSGIGTWPIKFSPPKLTFPAVAIGSTSPPQTVEATNYSSGTIGIISVVASGDFNVVPGGASQCGYGAKLVPGASCSFAVTFSPSLQGTINGVVTVTHTAVGSPQVVSLNGSGN